MSQDRDTLNQIGQTLQSLHNADEKSIAISFVAHAPGANTSTGSFSVTVTNGLRSETSEAVGLYDALYMARRKIMQEKSDDASGV